ncbi:acetamidase [Myriangium duriaei CBS 260.36]|uniref:amidase n=1 Tax=Myriangium duriaei CBS 260.36 TaxID=1168546 RepID=A0A9P4J1E9_9PEZI|nr:acetamidase [Myriangium duriaei CBS 260.36]
MSSWESIASSKREALSSSIPPEWRIPASQLPPESQTSVVSWPKDSGFFTSAELEITSLSASELLPRIHSGSYTAENVTRAYCKRAAVAQQLVNCLSETLFDSAIERAKELDAHFARTGKPVGPLHGLPVSLKDNFQVAGKDSTVGFVSWVGKPATTNSAMVDLLADLGAVAYVKTNVPTAMMIAETVNNVFGRTVNPLNRKLTSGGSSGGESALIAFGGSALGVGTDIGGSLRIPAAMTGIYTLRPSFGRFPTRGAKSGLAGQEAVNSVNGPMARTLADIELFSKLVVGAEPWKVDPKCLPIPWREVGVANKLKIGVLWHDGLVEPTPPVQRALKHTADRLRQAGHEVVDWSPELHGEILQVLEAFFVADGGETLKTILEPANEPWRPEMDMYNKAKELPVSQMWSLQAKRSQLNTTYLSRLQKAGLDAILCPTTPYACTENTKFKYVGYTGVFNVLDYAAVSFPTGLKADQSLDVATSGQKSWNEYDEQTRNDYNAAAVNGMPISLQLVAGRLEEEKLIAMTRKVLQSLQS